MLPLPYDATCSYGAGARLGPQQILAASHQVEWYDEETDSEPWRQGICTLRPVEPVVSGPEAYLDEVFRIALRPVADGKTLVGIGGEHSVTWALVRAVARRHKDVTVLQIDAHLDLRVSYQGSPFSHASVMHRVRAAGIPAVQVGVRSGSRDEWERVRRGGLSVFTAAAIQHTPDAEWIAAVIDAIPTGEVYVTIDVDGFDPAVFPGTGTPEPGGLSWWQGLALLRAVSEQRHVVGFDVVEVSPRPGCLVTEYTAAKLIYRMMAYLVAGA